MKKVDSQRLGHFSTVKKVNVSLQTKIRILEFTGMTLVKNGSETWVLWKREEDLLNVSSATVYG